MHAVLDSGSHNREKRTGQAQVLEEVTAAAGPEGGDGTAQAEPLQEQPRCLRLISKRNLVPKHHTGTLASPLVMGGLWRILGSSLTQLWILGPG